MFYSTPKFLLHAADKDDLLAGALAGIQVLFSLQSSLEVLIHRPNYSRYHHVAGVSCFVINFLYPMQRLNRAPGSLLMW